MNTATPCEALNSGHCLEINYDGYERTVEVHAVGYTSKRNLVMRVWQVRGGSESGEVTGWKLMSLDKANSMNISDEKSQAPRAGYKSGDSAMEEIICEL